MNEKVKPIKLANPPKITVGAAETIVQFSWLLPLYNRLSRQSKMTAMQMAEIMNSEIGYSDDDKQAALEIMHDTLFPREKDGEG